MFVKSKFFLHFVFIPWIITIRFSHQAKAQNIDEHSYNRFQYHKHQWQAFHAKSFHIYFPEGYDSICAFIARELPACFELVKRRMGAGIDGALNIVAYPSIDQLYESNIGGADLKDYTLPTVVLKGSRLLLAYNGSYAELRGQLREGIVRTVWEELFKNDLQSRLKDAAPDGKLPNWYKEGAISYFANGWTIADEDALRFYFEGEQPGNWQEVAAYLPRVAGTALCHYLSQQYYHEAPLQLLFQVRKKRSLPRAIRLIAKQTPDSVLADCFSFYHRRFTMRVEDEATPVRKASFKSGKGVTKSIAASEHDNLFYTSASHKERSIRKNTTGTETIGSIARYHLPPWISSNARDQYPLIDWDQERKGLLMALPEKGKLRLKNFGADGGSQQEQTLYGVDGITSIQGRGKNGVLLSAFRRGQSDIVNYDERKQRYTAYTDDIYDDQQPIDGGDGWIYFVSTRKLKREAAKGEDSMYVARGIFKVRDGVISPVVTDSVDFAEWQLLEKLPGNRFLATHTRDGTRKFAIVDEQGAVATLGSFRPFYLNASENSIGFYMTVKDSTRVIEYPLEEWLGSQKKAEADTISPWLLDYRKDAMERSKEDSILAAAKSREPSFLDGVLNRKNASAHAEQIRDSSHASTQYDARKVGPYVLQLHGAYFTARVNNDYFINRYQPYLNYQGQFKFPEVGGMARGGFTDLFENHHFSIAYKLPAGTEGSDFFLKYENTARNTDWSLMWFRKVESLQPDPKRNWKDASGRPYPNTAKVKTNYYEVSVKRPITYYLGTSFTTAIRHDRTVFLATENYSLKFDDINSTWSISTLSSNWSKLQPTLPLLYKGVRVKGTLDLFKGFSQHKDAFYGAGLSVEYHQPIYRFITGVGRLQAGHSGGSSRVLYNMGGVNNNLAIRNDTTVHFGQDAPYGFQTLVTPLRGYLQNKLSGNQYVLINLDVYFPIFQTLYPIETPLQSVNLLQLGLFTDFAYARETWRVVDNNNGLISLGFSARTLLAGYPIRFDMGWPGRGGKAVWYLSLGL